jgi:EAL domain-containing protein (putative c-di-GMP-specific phosphodiesterase class I)
MAGNGAEARGGTLGRGEFFQLLEALIQRSRGDGRPFGVVVARVQRLGEVNLLFDPRLSAAARACIEQALLPEDRVAQIGECDFAIALTGVRSPGHAALAANRLVRAFNEPLTLDGRPVQLLVAVGAAVFPHHGESAAELCRCAEIAFAEAMHASDRYAVYRPRQEAQELTYVDLREAVVNNRLMVHLQTFWDLRHDRVSGAESLARWDSPLLGPVSPEQFIPYAEQTGLITPLTRWSLNATLRYCGQARQAGRAMPFAINLSARVFHEPGIVEQILGAIEIWSVAPEQVILEVTENALMADPDISAKVLKRLRDAGLRIAIDDFGSGYSSFAYLKQFPATELKIDRDFVLDMAHDNRAAQLVRSMIDLAHNLDLDAIAEGVETAETALMLTEMDCDFAQGFFFGRPIPAEDFIAQHCTVAAHAGESPFRR